MFGGKIVKIILAGILCLFFGFNILAQEEEAAGEDENAPVTVEQITLQRDDGAGKAGDEVDSFLTTNKILHFRIQLSSQKSASVKMILVAADVKGLKAETKSVTVTYKTNGKQTVVNFNATPEDAWLAGKYRVDIFIDGKLADKKEFEIQSAQKVQKEQSPTKPDEKTKPKTVKRTRKT